MYHALKYEKQCGNLLLRTADCGLRINGCRFDIPMSKKYDRRKTQVKYNFTVSGKITRNPRSEIILIAK